MLWLIDLQGCQSDSRFGGIGRYSMSLAKAMLQLGTSHKIRLLLNSRLPNENFIRAEFAGLMPQQDILTFEIPPFVAAENELPAHTRMAELIREKRIAEIFWSCQRVTETLTRLDCKSMILPKPNSSPTANCVPA